MRKIWLFLLILALLPKPMLAQSADNDFGYDQKTLRYWQSHYRTSMPKVLAVLLENGFTPDERTHLQNITFRLPLDERELSPSEQDRFRDPLVFFVTNDSATVTMSITSIKFVDELTKAYAWLYTNECNFEPVFQYMALLKGNLPKNFAMTEGRYPTPLATLGIPSETFSDSDQVVTPVKDLALRFFNGALMFIIAHELGHILYHYEKPPPAITNQAQAKERNAAAERYADAVAIRVLAKAGVIPMGMFLLFSAWSHYLNNRWDFSTEAAWQAELKTYDHPLTPERMTDIAAGLEKYKTDYSAQDRETVQSIAEGMKSIAEFMASQEIQQSIYILKKADILATLKSLATSCIHPESSAKAIAFDGAYVGKLERHSVEGVDNLNVRLNLSRTDNSVTGTFDFGLGTGTLTGSVEDNILYFTWQWADLAGRGMFQESDDGNRFTGTWGYASAKKKEDKSTNAGKWSVARLMVDNDTGVAANPENDALIAAWSLPSLINEAATQTIDKCVQAAFEVSKWSHTLNGTLIWSSTGATYRPTPDDRMQVIYDDGRTIDFVITEIQGYPNEGSDEFLNRNYQINCRGSEKAKADLTINATKVGGITSILATGTVVFAEISYGVNTQIERNIYFESSSGGASYRNETAIQGNVTGPNFDLTLDDNFLFQLVSFEGRNASGSRRTTNNQWRVAGQSYAFENGVFARSDTNGHPAHVDIEWGAAGVIKQNNERWGALNSRVNGNFFEIWATLPKGEIKLAAISLS